MYQKIKEECCQANRELPRLGLVDITFGNVSVADLEKRVFAIKPSGVGYEVLQPEDIVVVNLEDGKVLEGALRFSSDTPTHRRLFLGFPGTRAVVHTHSRDAVAWAQAGLPIPCFGTTHADYFYGEVPVTRRMTGEEIAGEYEWETGNVIVERFQSTGIDPAQVPAVLVHGHGPFTWGPSAAKAVENALALEIIAEMAANTLKINPEAKPISKALLDKHFLRKHGPGAYYGQSK
ncbi:MAG: L-ribulose-5-phosphate 4-epimerase [Candidatus Methylacidiphilales bacterium]